MQQQNIFIKNATIVNCDSIQKHPAIFIQKGVIKFIGYKKDFSVPENTKIIDVKNKFVIPGGVEPSANFNNDFYHGTLKAVTGGTTTVIDFVKPKEDESLLESFQKRKFEAESHAVCDFSFVSENNVSLSNHSIIIENFVKEMFHFPSCTYHYKIQYNF